MHRALFIVLPLLAVLGLVAIIFSWTLSQYVFLVLCPLNLDLNRNLAPFLVGMMQYICLALILSSPVHISSAFPDHSC